MNSVLVICYSQSGEVAQVARLFAQELAISQIEVTVEEPGWRLKQYTDRLLRFRLTRVGRLQQRACRRNAIALSAVSHQRRGDTMGADNEFRICLKSQSIRPFAVKDRLGLDGIALILGTCQPTEGLRVCSSQVTVAIHEGETCSMDWRVASDRLAVERDRTR